MRARKVLVFPAGTEIGLEINESLRQCKEVEVFGAGIAGSNHAPFAFENFYELPSLYDSDWLTALVNLCSKLEIDYIFPAHDDALVKLASNRINIPAVVLTSSVETCLLTRSKRKTYNKFVNVLRVPKVFLPPFSSLEYPVFVKPDSGQGSQGATLVRSAEELNIATQQLTDPVICEYLPGEEYTVDCFSDRRQGLLFAGARVRKRMRNGIAVNTMPVFLEDAQNIATKIHNELKMQGTWFFQLKRTFDGELALLEIAPRIAGSMSVHRSIGVNFPLLSIFEEEKTLVRIMINQNEVELDRALQNRYKHSIKYNTMYIDLDETLVIREKVNVDAINLVFQCLNRGIKVKLLTRHSGNLTLTLKKFRLESLFDEIIHLGAGELKSEHIKDANSIFIDDSFSERLEVSQKLGILTFDCSMIEGLIR